MPSTKQPITLQIDTFWFEVLRGICKGDNTEMARKLENALSTYFRSESFLEQVNANDRSRAIRHMAAISERFSKTSDRSQLMMIKMARDYSYKKIAWLLNSGALDEKLHRFKGNYALVSSEGNVFEIDASEAALAAKLNEIEEKEFIIYIDPEFF